VEAYPFSPANSPQIPRSTGFDDELLPVTLKRTNMFRASVFAFLACAIVEASPLPCAWDVIQLANSSDAINLIGYGNLTSVSDVSGGTTSWLAPAPMSSDLYSIGVGGDGIAVGADGDSNSQPETDPNGLIPLDLSRFRASPLIVEVDINA
jgi:hypothetical protein